MTFMLAVSSSGAKRASGVDPPRVPKSADPKVRSEASPPDLKHRSASVRKHTLQKSQGCGSFVECVYNHVI